MRLYKRSLFGIKRSLFGIALIVFCLPFSLVAYGFIIRSIHIQGLQGIPEGTVLSYLPIHESQQYTPQRGQAIIATLYKTGFFGNVRLSRCGEALIITVKERPTTSLIRITGNKAITSRKLHPILNKLRIIEGQAFDPNKLKQIEQGLEQQYGAIGYYAAHVSTNVIKESRNRVALHININEGMVAKVRSIQFVGNHVFNVRTLRRQFKLTTPGLFTWISHADRYSEIRLEEDLESLARFYLNHAYLRFHIASHEVQWSLDKRSVYITVYINEGPMYRIGDYEISGETCGFKGRLYKLITLKSGNVFSRQVTIDINKKIGNFLADRGYAFARVTIIPTIDDQRHLVYINFNILPGERIYVRRINFLGNQRTDQEVLRREMCQYEGSIYSLSKIEESKRRLELLGYLSDVTYTSKPVPNSPNQVDLCYHVKEVAKGQASIQGGYSDVYGFLYGANISEPNFMGTGKYVSIGFQSNQYRKNYSISYNNPYYTIRGLQRGFSIYYSRIKPDTKFNLSSYLEDGYGADFTYGYPVSECNSITFGYGLGHITISHVDISNAAPSVLAFLGTINGAQNTSANYNQVKFTAGWLYNGLDCAIFPTKGLYTGLDLEVSVPIFKSGLDYYLATYAAKYYQPLGHEFILNLLATLGYGDGFDHDCFPFFKNFFSGGIGSVPAFAPNSLGPKNRYPLDSDFGAIGGNLETIFGVHLILPKFIDQKVRTAIVFDVGNVFQVPLFPGDIAIPARGGTADPKANTQPQIIQDDKFSLKNLRPSLGLSVEWYTPFAPIDFTLAFPLNRRVGDNFEAFQFSFGVSL
ncbi:MAG: outer membrane protein assembly factor BamA [Coxiella endosymbiont of Haemaphysalis qinghaiensis]